MFKRIMKISGIVLLAFVLIIGGVVAFLAIRGDFKKKVIKPTAIEFSIEETKLLFDVGVDANKVNSFTISAEPANITEKECTIRLSDTSLIEFVTWVDGEWKVYKSNTFYLNKPIYFRVKDINAENADSYTDGVLTITVTDKTGLLHKTLDLEIDRAVTSVSLMDLSEGGEDNNQISNGLFGYEQNYGGVDGLRLMSIIGQDYPLNFLSAPLKADKPFASREAKRSEIYYIENGQSKLLTHIEDPETKQQVFKLSTYNQATGEPEYEDCEFLRFDVDTGNYVLNSENSKSYEFKLAMYPTYAIQEEVLNGDFSLSERLAKMVTKTVIIDVSGTEATEIRFDMSSESIDMKLFEDNNFVANNPLALGVTNLGIILTKSDSEGNNGVEITGRYGELKFLDDDSYTSGINWTLQNIEKVDGKDVASTFNINIFNQNGTYTAEVTDNVAISDWIGNPRYDVELKEDGDTIPKKYILTLTCKTQDKGIEIAIPLVADKTTGKQLSLSVAEGTKCAEIKITKSTSTDKGVTYNAQPSIEQTWSFVSGSIMIVEAEDVDSETIYHINTLKEGLYLSILDLTDKDKKCINQDSFITSVQFDSEYGYNTGITIKPIKDLASHTIKMYAIVVNGDGTWASTSTSYTINISDRTTKIEINNSSEPLYLPVQVDAGELTYGEGINISERVAVTGTYAGAGYLMFAPKIDYIELTSNSAPADWGVSTYYKKVGGKYTEYSKSDTYSENNYYKQITNNFEIVENVNFEDGEGRILYLLGYFNEAGKFVNKVKANGLNYGSRIYIVTPKAEYIKEENRLQSATEYVDNLMKESYAKFNGTETTIVYDKSLIVGRKVYKQYVPASDTYNLSTTYYDSALQPVAEMSPEDINNWSTRHANYYELKGLDLINANGSEYIESRKYYDEEGNIKTITETDKDADGKIVCDAYLIVDHYNITSVTYSDDDVTIKAIASVYGQSFGTEKSFTITLAGTDELSISRVNEFDGATYIVANSYYDFDVSSIKPTSQYSGEYFSNASEPKVNDDTWKIVADHSSIELDWNGEKKGRLIKDQIASAVLTIGHKHSSQILDDMLSLIDVKAVEFDTNNNMISATKDAVTFSNLTKTYALATGDYVEGVSYYTASYTEVASDATFDSNNIYYNEVGEEYNIVEVTADTFATMKENLYLKEYKKDYTVTSDNYDTKKASLYVEALKVDFKVHSIISGDYMKLQWVYQVNSEIDFKFYSPKLCVANNVTTGYKIDTGIVTGRGRTYRKAVLLTDDSAPSDWVDGATLYIRDGKEFSSGLVKDGKFVVAGADSSDYEPNKYYRIDVDADITEDDIVNVNYIIEIGYIVSSAKYTYTVFACDKDGNLFVSMDDTTTAVAIDAIDAFNTGIKTSVSDSNVSDSNVSDSKDARWIKPVPAYAQNVDYELGSANNLTFTRDEHGVYTIEYAQINDEKQKLTLTDVNDKTIKLEIPIVKIVQDGKFDLNLSGLPDKPDATGKYSLDVKETTYQINTKSYTYNGTPDIPDSKTDITEKLQISIGNVHTSGYTKPETIVKDIVITDGENPAKTVKLEKGIWKFTRNTSASISFDVIVTSVLGTRTFTLNFTSPWDIDHNEKNTTEKIYSGTTFVLAYVENGNVNPATEEYHPLYHIDAETPGDIKITYSYRNMSEPKDVEITIGDESHHIYNGQILWLVPDVTEPTECTFKIYYTGIDPAEEIDTFVLTICPNIILTGDISDKELNDYNQTSVNLADLNLKQYKTETTDQYTYYPEYEEDASRFKDVAGDIKYIVNTYEDAEYKTKYTTNVASVDGSTLKVLSPISETGTYYVVVSVKSENILVGDIEFEVTTTSELKAVDDEDNVQDIQTIDLTATETKDFDLEDNLQSMFNLQRNGEFYYEVDSYEAGKTYKWDDSKKKYVPLTSEETGTNYYQKSTLTDIFWIHTEDSNLEIVYKYENYTLTQKGTTLTIEDVSTSTIKTYKLVVDSTSINIIENNAFDISTGKFKNIDEGKQGKVGNVHYIKEGGKSIYCAQNAYLFQNTATESSNEYIALSAESGGKKIYTFTINTNKVEHNSAIELENFAGIALTYNSFGSSQSANASEVANPTYKIEAIFKIGENVGEDMYVNIKDNQSYNISVAPYKVEPKTTVLLSGNAYTLYDETTATNGLFDIKTDHDNKISSIEFGKGDYTLANPNSTSKTCTITASAKGNSYTLTLPVTLTYNDKKTYSYDVEFTVLNNTQVEISYPFVVDSLTAENNAYGLFNSSITNITNGIVVNEDGTYARLSYEQFNVLYNDIGETLGYDTSVTEWFNDAKIKFDVALRNDTIKLTTDDLLNIDRYQAYSFKNVWQTAESETYSANTYYTYDAIANKFKVVSNASQPADWASDSWKYFSRVEKDADSIASTELVAVSATYADVLNNVVGSVIIDKNTIQISPSLSVSGYLVFKITTNTGAYGYYILKVLVNDSFASVLNYDATTPTARRTRSNEAEITPDGTSYTIKNAIGASGKSISDLGEIDASFVDSDWNNVYIFMVNNSIVSGGNVTFSLDINNDGDLLDAEETGIKYSQGKLIPNSAIIETNTNVQTLIVAVVIEYNGELIYVGNYRLALSPNVDVTQGSKVKKYNDSLYYQYELKEPHKYTYGATATDNTLTFNGDYFTVKINGGEEPITSPTVNFDNSKHISGEVKLAKPSEFGLTGSEFKLTGDDFKLTESSLVILHNSFESLSDSEKTEANFAKHIVAIINDTDLVITNPISTSASFWLELTYSSGSDKFNIYLKFNIAAYTFVSDTIPDKEVGLWNGSNAFNKTLNLLASVDNKDGIFDNYGGGFTVKYKENGVNTDFIDLSDIKRASHPITLSGTTLTFNQGTTEKSYILQITLDDVLTPIDTEFNVTVKPSINTAYNTSQGKKGETKDNPIVTTSNTSSVSEVGSSLYLAKSGAADSVKTIEIKTDISGTTLYTINVEEFSKVEFSLETENDVDKRNYILSNREMTDSGDINFAHTAMEQVLQLQITIYSASDTTYATQTLWIKLNQTYTLKDQYRAEGAEMETVVSGTILNTNLYTFDNTQKQYTPYTTEVTPQPTLYSITATLLETDDYDGDYYEVGANGVFSKATSYQAGKYYQLTATKITAKDSSAIAISNHLFGDKSSVVDNEHSSRFKLSVGDTEASSLASMQAIGLLTPGNPNYLDIARTGDCCTYANGILTFTYDKDKPSQEVVLNITNDTISKLQYKFQVMLAESDFGVVKYNTNLLHIDTDGDGVMDYISVTLDELRNENFVLATLNYAPADNAEDGTIGYINQNGDAPIKFKFDGKNVSVANYGHITTKTSKELLGDDYFATITLSIVTVDGCEREVDIVVSDFKVDYGYISSGQDYEQLYGGTEGWDITKNLLTSDTPRITLTNGGTIITPTFASNFEHYENVEGEIIDKMGDSLHLALGTPLGTSYVSWNKDKNTFGLRSVDDNGKNVVIMFNVKHGGYIIGRVYYRVQIINDIKIGMNRQMGDVTRYDLYLGSAIYSKTDNTKEINLLQSRNEDNYNNIFITLEQYSTGNVIYDNGNLVNKALYNGSAGADGKADNTNKTYSVYSAGNVGNYLRFAVDNVSSGLLDEDKKSLVTVDSTMGILKITGNVEGSFDLLVYSTNGSGYGKSFTIQVHKYYEVVTKFNNSVDSKGGDGYVSGEKVNLIKSDGELVTGTTSPINNNYAINIHRIGVKDLKGTVGYIEHIATTNYRTLIVPASTAINDIKQSTAWPSMHGGTNYHKTIQPDLPNVPYSSNPDETEYYIVAVRCLVTCLGTEDYYYAFYKVYNNVSVSVNPHYIENDRTITYNETNGAWSSDGNGNIITIMDAANTGLYSLLTPLTSKPEGWASDDETINYKNYCKAKFDPVTSPTDDVWKQGLYYQKDSDDNYTLLTSKPANWITGEWYKIDTYESLSSETATPTWRQGCYYTYNDSIERLATTHDLGVNLMVEDSRDPTGYKAYELNPYNYIDAAEWSDRLQYYYLDDDPESESYGQHVAASGLTEVEFAADPTTKYCIRQVQLNDNCITAILPDNLFTNKAKMYVALVDLNTNTELLKQEWTIQGDKTIENYDSRPLSDFFLQSEIGQKWYNTEIIGITAGEPTNTSSFTQFIIGTVDIAKDGVIKQWDSEIYGYMLYKVTYEITGGNFVFNIRQDYYVLQGKTGAMKINFNAGSSIVINIDDSRLDKDGSGKLLNSATIDLSGYVLWTKLYSPESGKYILKDFNMTETGISVGETIVNKLVLTITINRTKYPGYTASGSTIKVDNVTSFEKLQEVDLTFTLKAYTSEDGSGAPIGGCTFERKIKVMFNYVINAKEFDKGNIKDASGSARNLLATKLASADSLTVAEVNADSELKKALLGLITYQDSDIDTSDTARYDSNSVYNAFSITVNKTVSGNYTLEYTYKDAVSEYTRTFTLAGATAS